MQHSNCLLTAKFSIIILLRVLALLKKRCKLLLCSSFVKYYTCIIVFVIYFLITSLYKSVKTITSNKVLSVITITDRKIERFRRKYLIDIFVFPQLSNFNDVLKDDYKHYFGSTNISLSNLCLLRPLSLYRFLTLIR